MKSKLISFLSTFPVLLSLIVAGCTELVEPDAKQFLAPVLWNNNATLVSSSTKVSLSASIKKVGKSSNMKECGFYYADNADMLSPSIVVCSGKEVLSGSAFSKILAFKEYGKTYWYRPYISNGVNEITGSVSKFTLRKFSDCVQFGQLTCSNQNAGSVVFETSLTFYDGVNVTARGFEYSTSENFSSKQVVDAGTSGTFKALAQNLKTGTGYFVRAFVKDGNNIAYSAIKSFTTYSPPVLTTSAVTQINATSAVSGGEISSDGGSSVTARGVVWSTSQNPTVSLSTKTSDGSGIGSFSSKLTGLAPGTRYYVRAYAINSVGTSYGNEVTFTTSAVLATVTTSSATSVTSSGATLGGKVTSDGGSSVTEYGIVWGTSDNPTTSDHRQSGSGVSSSFSVTLSGLAPGTRYYIRAYAINGVGTSYGPCVSFTTGILQAELSTAPVSSITSSSAVSGGEISSDGGSSVTARGVVWSTSQNPTVSLSTKTSDGSGSGTFSSTLTNLKPGTRYYVRAYATNSAGTSYGNEVTFTTSAALATVTTSSATSVTSSGATLGGNVTSDGGSSVTEYGIVWGTSDSPTTSGNRKSAGGSSSSFSVTLSGLAPGTVYYVRAYAINSVGTSYGNEVTFTTSAALATVTTSSVTSVTSSGATLGGNVTSDGGSSVSSRGVVWSTSQNPTVSLSTKTSDGSGSGTFSSTLTNLKPGTRYYVRAYATNSAGTSYGNEVTFTTSAALATVTTSSATSVTSSGATLGGKVTSDGGSSVTEYGIVWGTSDSPTTSGNRKSAGGSSSSFSVTLSGLAPGTVYYVRAYAINSVGTSYGPSVSFTTGILQAELSTAPVSSITSSSAVSGGEISSDGGSSVSSRGVVWSTSQNPTVSLSTKTSDGSGSGAFSSTLTNLKPGTRYYVRAYAINSVGTSYGPSVSFTTGILQAELSTAPVSSITSSSAVSGGEISSDGGSSVTARGVVWSTSQNPTVSLSTKTSDGSGIGSFSSKLTGLAPGTRYYVRAYATNGAGTSYGAEQSFTTSVALATVTTSSATSVTSSGATLGGKVTSDGGSSVTEYGIVWGTSDSPTTSGNRKSAGGSSSSFSVTLSGLAPGTVYYVRAYAINSVGTSYGPSVSFTTGILQAELSTAPVSSITSSSAVSGGEISSDGGSSVTARGVVWSTSQNPTVSLSTKTSDGSGIGSFSSKLTGLAPGTVYYVRAYAINGAGTSYGNVVSFVAAALPAKVTTSSVSSVRVASAEFNGNVTDTGGGTVTERGFVWGTEENPTISDNRIAAGTGKGSFKVTVHDLSASTVYHVRAYAVNDVGVAYGNDVQFTTAPGSGTEEVGNTDYEW